MKTALQQLIEELKEASNVGSNQFIITTINLVIEMCEAKIEVEKNQIIEAVDDAISETKLYESFRGLESGEQYYNETFKN